MRDRLGRRRDLEQSRGLRPRFPVLPPRWLSRVMRVAMSERDWERFDALVSAYAGRGLTEARARGLALSDLLQLPAGREPVDRSAGFATPDWLDWEARKADRLLLRSASRGARASSSGEEIAGTVRAS
jgi:hypothetical protein